MLFVEQNHLKDLAIQTISKLIRNPRSWSFRLKRVLLNHTDDHSEIYRTLTFVSTSGIGTSLSLLLFFIRFFSGQYILAGSLGILIACLSIVFYLTISGRFTLSKQLFLVAISSSLFFVSSTQGRQAGHLFMYFPTLLAVFLFFSFHQKKQIIFFSAFIILQILVLEYTDFSLFRIDKSTPDIYNKKLYNLFLFFSIILCIHFVSELNFINRRARARLKHLNKRLKKKNDVLLKTNSELDAFVYRTSHDIRAPLRSILGICNLIRIENDHTRTPFYINLLENSTKRLDSYVLEVLEMSKNAKSEIQIQSIDLEPFVWEIYEKLKYMMGERKVDFEFWCEGTHFQSDISRLRIIVSNLLGNSIKYSNESCQIQLNITTDEKEARFIFQDNGQGISPDALPRIFDMFYRANEKSDGSGLGLYIVKETVDKLGGKIKIESTLGIGTNVFLSIPNKATD